MAFLDKNHPQISHVRQCGILSVSRSSTYYKPKVQMPVTVDFLNEIRETWEAHPFYGYRRIHADLCRKGLKINRKRVQRLMQLAGLQAIYPKPKTSLKNRKNKTYPYLLKNRAPTAPNQVWATDITYIKLPQGHVYLIALIDLYSRYILSWRLSNSLSAFFCLEALNEALEAHETPDIFNTDQGVQFTSDEWIYTLKNWGIQPSMTGVGRCLDNVYVERFWRALKYENTYIYGYENMPDARQKIGDFIKFYNQQRPHQSLGYKVPEEVYRGPCLEGWPDGYVDNSLDLKVELSTYPQALCLSKNKGSRVSLI